MSDIFLQKKNPLIMVVDDDPFIRQTLCDILKLEKFMVLEVENGDSVIKTLIDKDVDIILLDINMPGLSGIEVTRKLKSDDNFKHIPVVIVTGQNDFKYRIEALKAGADDFLIKPPHLQELLVRVRSLLKVKAYNDHQRNYRKLLEKQVEKRSSQLTKALSEIKTASLETIHHLSRAAEYKDEDTAIHIKRMSHYAASIAENLGMERDRVELILYASSMHDIGKIGIPDNILMKKGKLTPEEWKIMKGHTLIGAEILKGSNNDLIRTGRIISLNHHEKWDGSGYPSGLKSCEIPLEGRICAVADVFDALTSKRPYKEAFSFEKAVVIIREGRETNFDPEITDTFMGNLETIKDIMNHFKRVKNL